MAAMRFASDAIDTRHIEGTSAIYAYRDFGVANSSPPLVLLTRFRGTMDHRIPRSWILSPPSGV
jgi:hypothetical protein